jgi:hypothetical protein
LSNARLGPVGSEFGAAVLGPSLLDGHLAQQKLDRALRTLIFSIDRVFFD